MTTTTYTLWSEANKAKTTFWTENVDNWTPEVDAVYSQLLRKSEELFYAYRAEVTGKSVDEVAYEVNSKIHSARD